MAADPEEIEVIIGQTEPVITGDGQSSVTEFPDGSEEYSFYEDDSLLSRESSEAGFDENLAEMMTGSERSTYAAMLIEFKRVDLESRMDWDAMAKRALKMLGVERIDASNLPFPGAAEVYHPVIAEAVVQFQANAIEEFFPATGPVKGDLAGEATEELTAQVERAEDYMNYYLTVEDKGYYADCDQELFILPVDGSTFKKTFKDPRDKMCRSRFVRAADFIAPYFASDLENTPRYCHRYTMTGEEIENAIRNGEFMQMHVDRPSDQQQDEVSSKDRSDRLVRVLHERDRLYTILEYHVEYSLPSGVDKLSEEGDRVSYVVHCIEETSEIAACRRNWNEDDPDRKKEIWFSHKKFLPGLGFYGWGFPHVIGSLGEAASGAVRALLDSAAMATLQGGFRAKDGIKLGGEIRITPGTWKDVDATSEELAKSFFTPPFKEPSPALFQLLDRLVNDARRFASITEVVTGQANNKAPVGTTLALIEQSLKLFTAIHKRIFAAARQEFTQLAKLIHRYVPFDEYPYYLKGEAKFALKSDFDERVDFLPVADPNIISAVQRISLSQAVLELVSSAPDLYGPEQRAVAHAEFLKALKVPYADKIKPKVPKPTYADPVTENALALIGKGIRAFPGQLHAAHIQAHQLAANNAAATLPPDQAAQVVNNLMAHIREHMALEMMEQVSANMVQSGGVPMPPIDIYNNEEDMPPELEMALSVMAAQNLPPPIQPPEPEPEVSDQDARDTEAAARIERDTAGFVAKQKMDQAAHAQRMQQAAELHAQKMGQMDDQTAADILRKNADAVQRRRQQTVEGSMRMAFEGRREKMKSALQQESAGTKKSKPKPK